MIKRYLEKHILRDLREKMVFISGPRQVGKTTMAVKIGKEHYPGKTEYLNWDNRQDRKAILNGFYKTEKKLYIFDEIHKYRNWKNFLKGEYDKYGKNFGFLITGSGRLDVYRKTGDSLLGRYHSYKLHPLSLAELNGHSVAYEPFSEPEFPPVKKETTGHFGNLFKFGGFPEILLKQDERELRRWHNERTDRLIREDIRDVENLRDLSALQVLAELLPARVGSLFSLNSLREDLNVAYKTMALWIDILERFYYHFRIYPFQSTLVKSLRKEPKLYLWDWSEIENEEIRFENMVAGHLLKFRDYLSDVHGHRARLHYWRDKEQREVDFIVSVGNRPWFSVEVKTSAANIPAPLFYLKEKLKIPYNYVVIREEGIDRIKENIRFISADKFLNGLV